MRTTYIGIDLAWTNKNESGICILDNHKSIKLLCSKVYSLPQILHTILPYCSNRFIIAIDAPIIVNNHDGSRCAEKELFKNSINGFKISAFQVSRKFMLKHFNCLRGEELYQLLLLHFSDESISTSIQYQKNSILETFPTAIIAGLFPNIYPLRYKSATKKSDKIKKLNNLIQCIHQELQTHLAFPLLSNIATLKEIKHTEDQLDAFLCAYACYTIDKGVSRQIIFGKSEEGVIIIPERMPS